MGIYRFYSQFLSRIGERVIIKGLPQRLSPHGVEGVIFDLNGMLHNVAQRVFMYGKAKQDAVRNGNLEEFRAAKAVRESNTSFQELMDLYVQELAKELNETLTILSPKQYLIIAVDGMVPGAKILQQRSRRYKTFVDLSLSHGGENDDKPIAGFDTTMISPGTPFMNDVDTYLRAWLSQGLEMRKEWVRMSSRRSTTTTSTPPRGLLPGVIHYSSHLVNGEGEHKAFEAIRELLKEFSIVQGSGAHVVYGADADLSMLSLLSPLRNILLSRENLSQYIDIEELYLEIRKRMTRNETSTASSFPRETISRDFVLMSNLIGNDFLPSSIAFQTMGTILLDAYASIEAPLTSTTSAAAADVSEVILSSLGNFFYILSTKETAMLIESAKSELRDKGTQRERVRPSRILLESYSPKTETLNFESFRGKWYEDAAHLRNESITQSLPFYESISSSGDHNEQGLFTTTSQAMRRMVCDYVATMNWVLRYYEGGGKSINWLHSYRFVVAPLANDVAHVIIREYPKVTKTSSTSSSSSRVVVGSTVVDFYSVSCVLSGDKGSNGFTNKDGDPRSRGRSAISLSTQLLIITPPSQIEKVLASAKDLALLTASDSGALAFLAPDDPSSIEIYLDGKRAKYEGIPILPEVDFIKTMEIIKNYEALYRSSKLTEAKAKREKKEREGYGPHIDKFGVEKIVPVKIKALIPMKLSSAAGEEPIVFKPSEMVREVIAKKLGKSLVSSSAATDESERKEAAAQIEASKVKRAYGEGEMGGAGRWGVGSIEDIGSDEPPFPAAPSLSSPPPPVAIPPKQISSSLPSFFSLQQTQQPQEEVKSSPKKKTVVRKPRAKKTAEVSSEEEGVVVPPPSKARKPRAKKTTEVGREEEDVVPPPPKARKPRAKKTAE